MAVMGGGKTQVIANTASIANGDNIVSYLADAAGTLLTSTGGKLDVYPASTYAEDAAHASGDLGQLILAVRNDAGTALAGTDGQKENHRKKILKSKQFIQAGISDGDGRW